MLIRYSKIRRCFPCVISGTRSCMNIMRLRSSVCLFASNHSCGSSQSKKSLGKEWSLSNFPKPISSVSLS